ncbi:hypothetical protein CYMTET_31591, partial [Cymbomonas tetramitiformis]
PVSATVIRDAAETAAKNAGTRWRANCSFMEEARAGSILTDGSSQGAVAGGNAATHAGADTVIPCGDSGKRNSAKKTRSKKALQSLSKRKSIMQHWSNVLGMAGDMASIPSGETAIRGMLDCAEATGVLSAGDWTARRPLECYPREIGLRGGHWSAIRGMLDCAEATGVLSVGGWTARRPLECCPWEVGLREGHWSAVRGRLDCAEATEVLSVGG